MRLLFPGRLGTRFTLGLRGVVLGVGPQRLTMRVSAVRWWPNGRWTDLDDRVVSLWMPAGAPLGASDERTVFTRPAKVTAAALRGDDGVLRAARVLESDGTTVQLDPTAGDETP